MLLRYSLALRNACCLILLILLSVVLTGCSGGAEKPTAGDWEPVVGTYIDVVHRSYVDTLEDAKTLRERIDVFLEDPNQSNLRLARQAWKNARVSYGQTESYRFYGGPIDFSNPKTGRTGPEGQLNAWPLDEAYIDYVEGRPNSGIIQDPSVQISRETLTRKNQENAEADVSTGYHAIEFLLWGQDLYDDSPGRRPVSDYESGDRINERRRKYLRVVTDLLVEDLQFLVDEWKPDAGDNYAAEFRKRDPKKAVSDVMTAIATLSGFELASERMAVPLDSGDQEDEHSCFSDHTHVDFLANMRAITNVYYGTYEGKGGKSIYSVLRRTDPKLAGRIASQLSKAESAIVNIPAPVDREVLATSDGSSGRKTMERAVSSLQTLADQLKKSGDVLGVSVQVIDG